MHLVSWLVILGFATVASAGVWTFRRPRTRGGKLLLVTIWAVSGALVLLLAVLVFRG